MRHQTSGAARVLRVVLTAAALAACGGSNRTVTGSGRCHNGVCQGDPAGASSGGEASDASVGGAGDASAPDAAPNAPP